MSLDERPRDVLLTLDSKEIEALSQFYFWLHKDDQSLTDALSQPDEKGSRHLMTIEEMAEAYGADEVFARIDEAWKFMCDIPCS